MGWVLEQYEDDPPKREVATYDEGLTWIKEHMPSRLDAEFQIHRDDFHQWGTNDQWVSLTLAGEA